MVANTSTISFEIDDEYAIAAIKRLKQLPGIRKLSFDILDVAPRLPSEPQQPRAAHGNNQQTIIAILLKRDGPACTADFRSVLGGNAGRTATALNMLKTKGIVERVGPGTWQLTAKAAAGLKAHGAPAPDNVRLLSHHPKRQQSHSHSRTGPGKSRPLILGALEAGPVRAADLKHHLTTNGLSAKSFNGLIHKMREEGLVRTGEPGQYERTEKGTTFLAGLLGKVTNGAEA